MFYREIFDSAAFQDLSPYSQTAYLHFRAKYREFRQGNGAKGQDRFRVGNAEDISLTYSEMGHLMSRGKYSRVLQELWEHGLIEYVRHGGPGKVCSIFRIDGFNDRGEQIRLSWPDWTERGREDFVNRLKDGGSRVDRKKYSGYGFERQWQENPERMQEAVLKGVRKRQCRMTQAFS
jgi:hypothetical protein